MISMTLIPPPRAAKADDAPASPGSTDPLGALARAAGVGDRAAMRRVLDGVAPHVPRVARGLLGRDHPEVADAVQDSLLAIVRALPACRGECTVVHFAVRVAFNHAATARRRNKTAVARVDALQHNEPSLSVAPRAPDAASLAERRRVLLRELLDELPAPQATAMTMRVALDYSNEEIADAEGVPVNTVRSRIRLAREALRRRIDGDSRFADLQGGLAMSVDELHPDELLRRAGHGALRDAEARQLAAHVAGCSVCALERLAGRDRAGARRAGPRAAARGRNRRRRRGPRRGARDRRDRARAAEPPARRAGRDPRRADRPGGRGHAARRRIRTTAPGAGRT